MIKINLLGDNTAVDNSGKLIIAGFLGSLAACLIAFYCVQSSLDSSLAELEVKSQSLQNELNRVQKTTKEVRELEARKAEYSAKLLVIAMLKKNKLGPVHVLDDLNNALPEKAWLTEVKEKDGAFTVSGRALDNQTVAAFIRELEKSDYFGEQSNQVLKQVDKDGVKIKEFSFQSKIFYGGKLAAQQAEAAQNEASSAAVPEKKG